MSSSEGDLDRSMQPEGDWRIEDFLLTIYRRRAVAVQKVHQPSFAQRQRQCYDASPFFSMTMAKADRA